MRELAVLFVLALVIVVCVGVNEAQPAVSPRSPISPMCAYLPVVVRGE